MPDLSKDELGRFLPHEGAMRLIDRWSRGTTRPFSVVRDRIETRRIHCGMAPASTAVTGLEYAAQAMGVHVGLLNGRDRRTD